MGVRNKYLETFEILTIEGVSNSNDLKIYLTSTNQDEPCEHTAVALLEYDQATILVEVPAGMLKPGDQPTFDLSSSLKTGDAHYVFKGRVSGLEDVCDGRIMASVSVHGRALENLSKFTAEWERREAEIHTFMKMAKGH